MNNKQGSVEGVSLDLDAVWVAISRSKKFKDYMDKLAKEVEQEASSIAAVEAIDDGYYKDLFQGEAMLANKVERFYNMKNVRYARKRSGVMGSNRFFDPSEVKGDVYGNDYSGSMGVVVNTDFKAAWVEYGTIVKGPKSILARSAEKIANNYGYEFVKIYTKTHEANSAVLGQKISEGKKASAKSDKEGGVK